MERAKGIFFHWLPLAVAIVGISGLMCISVQQNYRHSLNDPQVQMVEDAVTGLLAGFTPSQVVWGGSEDETPFDASKSLKPFIAIYDEKGNAYAYSANIFPERPPHPPEGVFTYTKERGEDRVTWQPDSTTRIALVVKYVTKGSSHWFVVAGRNMREVEAREEQLTHIIGVGLVAILFITLIAEIVGDTVRRRQVK